MSDEPEFSWYMVCESDCCEAFGWATKEQAEEDRKHHEWVNPHNAKVVPGEDVVAAEKEMMGDG